MPRIDPIKLLNCLSVLLLPNGGIKGTVEVKRLAEMMTKYSKKLVSKCIYIQILKYTESSLLDLFMVSDGWSLVHLWLTESIVAKNWPLVKELLELLLLCPVDIERLKTNNCPKLVKELSKDEDHYAIKVLASKLVEQWLKIVKGEQPKSIIMSDIPKFISDINNEEKAEKDLEHDVEIITNIDKKLIVTKINNELTDHDRVEQNTLSMCPESSGNNPDNKDEFNKEVESLPVLKITLKNGKQIVTQVVDDSKVLDNFEDKSETKDKNKNRSRDKTSDRNSSNSSKSSSSKHSSKSKSSSDKHHSHKDSSSKNSSSSSSSKDKKRDKDRYSSSSHSSKSKSNNSSSSTKKTLSSSKLIEDKNSPKSSPDKERTIDKVSSHKEKLNLEIEEKPKSASTHKLGKYPKLSDIKREKPSISIEVRKPEDPKPKTVKTFHSKFRKHGLEEEVQPPPSRASVLTKKPLPALPPTVSIPKRPSPIYNESPPEKKLKPIDVDKPGAIKLIPPKPKRSECRRHYYIPESELNNFLSVCDLTRLRWIHQQFSGQPEDSLKSHWDEIISDATFVGEGSNEL